IKDVLLKLKENGAKIAVCSSKYEKFAEEIVKNLGVSDCFDAVCGSTLDGSRKDKKDLIPYAVKSLGGDFNSDKENTVMLGDTYFDARGARQCGVDFIGVEYGYGSIQAIKDEGAEVFAKTPADLLPLLIG
ncbi:MAG: HAD hydrolase-like protein, partial [Ruminococcus sp.]|nr:HAD hydrolase-like protein [Ruminococcus sp.]